VSTKLCDRYDGLFEDEEGSVAQAKLMASLAHALHQEVYRRVLVGIALVLPDLYLWTEIAWKYTVNHGLIPICYIVRKYTERVKSEKRKSKPVQVFQRKYTKGFKYKTRKNKK